MCSTSGNGGRRRSSSSSLLPPPPPEEGVLRCPRCDSPNTKFCYYNNYSLTQPRHYCKACRRYWTRGGALRNVPVGGGCRKNKKTNSSSLPPSSSSYSMSSSRLTLLDQNPEITHPFKFFQGFSPEFNLGDRFNSNININNVGSNQFSSYGDLSAISSDGTAASSTANATSLMGMISYPTGNFSEPVNNCDSQSRIASTIESLSSINQDLHWKLQQQRFALMYGGENHHHHHHQKNDPVIVSDIPNPYLQNQNLPISYQMPLTSDSMTCFSGSAPRSNLACVGDGINSSTGWYLDENSRNSNGNFTDVIKICKDWHQFSALP